MYRPEQFTHDYLDIGKSRTRHLIIKILRNIPCFLCLADSQMSNNSEVKAKSKPPEPKKNPDSAPSVAKLIKQVRKEANKTPQDWQKEYEERKKAAMAAMNSKSVKVGSLSAFHKK